MDGIEPVKRVLEDLAVRAFFAVIEANGDHCEYAESLNREEESVPCKGKFESESLEEDDEEQNERQKLKESAEFHVAENVKRDHNEYAHCTVVNESDRADNEEECDLEQAEYAGLYFKILFEFVDLADRKQAEQQGEHHVLMEWEEKSARRHQIEGDLGYKTEDEKPFCIFFEIRGVNVSLRDHKGKNGESKPAHAGHPLVAGYDGCPKMVKQHQYHRKCFECV